MSGLFQSKRFWASVAGVVATVAAAKFGLDLDEQQITNILMVVSAWIVGDSLRPATPK